MSDAVAACRTYLKTQSGVTDLVGAGDAARIYFGNLPQDATLEAVVLEQSGDDLVRHLAAADTLRRTSINVIAYAGGHTEAAALGDALVAAIEFGTGTWGSVGVRRAYIEGVADIVEPPQDGSQNFRYVRSLLAVVWHT